MLLLRTFLESDKTENVRLSLSYAEHKNDGFLVDNSSDYNSDSKNELEFIHNKS